MPIVGNLLNSLPRLAVGLGSTLEEMQTALIAGIEKPLAHRVVSSAPCQEEVIAEPSLAESCRYRASSKKKRPYITAGAIVAKDRSAATPTCRLRG